MKDKRVNEKNKQNHVLNDKNTSQENLSEKDLEGLMGTRRPTYSRGRGGAYKQRY